MRHPKSIRILLPASALAAAFAVVPASADQVVYFINGKALTVKSVERGDKVTILEIDGGGRIGVPTMQIDRVEELQLSAPAAIAPAVAPAVALPSATAPPPAPGGVQPASNPQPNAAGAVAPVAPAVASPTAPPVTSPAAPAPASQAAPANRGTTGLPGAPFTEEQLEGGPPQQVLPPSYNPASARGAQYGGQPGGMAGGPRFNNNASGAIGRPDSPRGRFNARLGGPGRVRPPMTPPPAGTSGQGQPPANQPPAGQAPANQAAAPPAPPAAGSNAPAPPPAPPQPPPADASQNDPGADNGAAAQAPPDDPPPADQPADDNPPDGN
jgi:hypothetical protein